MQLSLLASAAGEEKLVQLHTRRVLFLANAPNKIARQLDGEDLSLGAAIPLRDNISTDEITPTTVMTLYDKRLGDFPYVGLQVDGQNPIAKAQVKAGGFSVVVGGKRYGKGSSRESSPIAEKNAGIQLVIAESFERIYRQNAHNVGLLTSTDFGLIERIARGEVLKLAEFTEGHDALTRLILESGGLLQFSRKHLQAFLSAKPVRLDNLASKNYSQKIVDRSIMEVEGVSQALELRDGKPIPGQGIFLKTDWRFSHEYFTGMAAHLMHECFGNPAPVFESRRIVAFQDHLTYVGRSEVHRVMNLTGGVDGLAKDHYDFVKRYQVNAHGALPVGFGSEGICHAMMAERYVLPGEVVVGTDSHTPHSGSVGCLAFGAGATDMAHAWMTGLIRTKYPAVCKVELGGRLAPGVTSKDVVLELLRSPFIADGGAIGMIFEFCGDAVRAMSLDERATLTNMVAELGGFTGIVEPDEKTVNFLKERRGIDFHLEPWMSSDMGATYDKQILIDCERLEPMFAAPGDPGNGVPYSQIKDETTRIDIAYGGSCTAGKRSDFDQYFEVFSWAVENDLKVPSHVALYLQFGTSDVKSYCERSSMLDTFAQVGAELLMPGCGACANCGPGSSTAKEQVTVSAINRNFPGRSGPGKVWLASPASVAASAIAGELITFGELKRRFKSQTRQARPV